MYNHTFTNKHIQSCNKQLLGYTLRTASPPSFKSTSSSFELPEFTRPELPLPERSYRPRSDKANLICKASKHSLYSHVFNVLLLRLLGVHSIIISVLLLCLCTYREQSKYSIVDYIAQEITYRHRQVAPSACTFESVVRPLHIGIIIPKQTTRTDCGPDCHLPFQPLCTWLQSDVEEGNRHGGWGRPGCGHALVSYLPAVLIIFYIFVNNYCCVFDVLCSTLCICFVLGILLFIAWCWTPNMFLTLYCIVVSSLFSVMW